MNDGTIVLTPGSLWGRILQVTADALGKGALQPIATGYEFIDEGGVRFFIRMLEGIRKKDEAKMAKAASEGAGRTVNPFLPYERDLFVSDVSDTHVALLNKFNVVDHHLLIVTRTYEDQDMLLTLRDFEALRACIKEYHSLGFYNGGTAAGASQPHKHLQVVPLPLAPEGPAIPLGPLFGAAKFSGGIGTVPGFSFKHAFVALHDGAVAAELYERYNEMLVHAGLEPQDREGTRRQSGPYCLLMTRQWMLLVPRSEEFYHGISLNSLAYAGALLVRDHAQMDLLRRVGPMTALRSAGVRR